MKNKKRKSNKKLFLNKKGVGNEIDWIIAIGVFLIYLTLTFVFFKPGIKAVYNQDNLLDIVEINFMKSAYWNILIEPMFVQAINCEVMLDGSGCSTLTGATTDLEFKGTYKFENSGGLSDVSSGKTPFDGIPQEYIKVFFVPSLDTETSETSGGAQGRSARTQNRDDSTARDSRLSNAQTEAGRLCSPPPDVFPCCTSYLAEISGKNENDADVNKDKKKACEEYIRERTQSETTNTEPTEDHPVPTGQINTPTVELRPGYVSINMTTDSSVNNNKLKFKPYFYSSNSQKTKYIVTIADKVINTENPAATSPNMLGSATDYQAACIIPNFENSKTIGPTTQCKARYEIGAAESYTGIHLISIANYPNIVNDKCGEGVKGYACLKKLWGFPDLKEFKIRVYDKQNLIAEFPAESMLPNNVNVYSRRFSSFVLNEDGLTKPVTVDLLVW